MKKINVLFVAPYQEIVPLVRQVAAEHDNINVAIEIADMDSALPVAYSLRAAQFDVVISRGGTGRLLMENMPIPTVFVELSGYDVLRLIQTLQMFEGKAAMVCFAELANAARTVCGLLQYHLNIYEINSTQEAERAVDQLKTEGYTLIIGDVLSVRAAGAVGLKTILATSGVESIRKAFNDTIHIAQLVYRNQTRCRYGANLLVMQKSKALVLSREGNMLFCAHEVDGTILKELQKQIPLLEEKKELYGTTETAPVNYSFVGNYFEGNPEEFFFVLQEVPLRATRRAAGFSVHNPGTNHQILLNSFVAQSAVMREQIEKARQISESMLPVMIYGKAGTERETMAQAIHWSGTRGNTPIYRVDVLQARENLWHMLFKSENSPLLEPHYTLLLLNFQRLSLRTQAMLLQFIRETRLFTRARIITVSNQSPELLLSRDNFLPELVELLSTASLRMPDLCQRREDIRSLIGLCIDECSRSTGKSVIGIEEDALNCLQDYDWPYNLPQLRHMVRQCVAETDGSPYIAMETVKEALRGENESVPHEGGGSGIPNGTLAEIETKIITCVLEQEKMNQMKAAKRLGISRTTMWRKIRRAEEKQ